MNTRRIPFQFSTTDPLDRQRELEKRFGLQPTCPKMYVDVNNPLLMGSSKETSSPRLQHRVPIFAEGYDQPIHSSVDSMASVPDNKKPNVRVIPIEIEGVDNKSQRHRTYSGPADTLKDRCGNVTSDRCDTYPFKRFNFEDLSKPSKPKLNAEPRIYNIPIQVEGSDSTSKRPKIDTASKLKTATLNGNGCSLSKSPSKVKPLKDEDDKVNPESIKEQADQPNPVEILIKKIEDILTEFKTYENEVLEFNGTSKDKQYRYLDEMLTRCMLRLDSIDTMGNEEIRLARKNAVKKIQASIDLLESKANVESVTSLEVPQMQVISDESSVVDKVESNEIELQNGSTTVSTENKASSEIKGMDLSVDDEKDHSKASGEIMINQPEVDGDLKAESDEMIESSQDKATDVSEIEMAEDKIELSKTADKLDDHCLKQGEGNLHSSLEQNSVSEMLRSDCKNIEQNEVLDKNETSDVEMVDEKEMNSTEECLPLHETAEKKNDAKESSEASDVEMVEIQSISSEESGKKLECETAVDGNSDSAEHTSFAVDSDVQVTSTGSPRDAEMEDIPCTLTDVPQSKTCMSEQSVNSVSS